jgi:hypothetical protein
MPTFITIDLAPEDAELAADLLDKAGQGNLEMVNHWRRYPVEVDWDHAELEAAALRACSIALQLRYAILRGRQADQPVVRTASRPPIKPAGATCDGQA